MPSVTPLPPAPSRNDPTNFAERGDALVAALPTLVAEINAVAGAMGIPAERGSAFAAHNEAVTVLEVPEHSMWMAFAQSPATNYHGWCVVSRVAVGNAPVIVHQSNGGCVFGATGGSGGILTVYQASGAGATINWTYVRIY